MRPMPFEKLSIQASDDATALEWFRDLAGTLARHYPKADTDPFQAALAERLNRPDIRPALAEDGGMYFVQLLERAQTLTTVTLPEWLRGVPLLETLLERKVIEVQLVERLVLPDPTDVPG